MSRLLVIPAAGRGSRLGFDGPKALCPVNGRPMLAHLLDRYAPLVDHVVVVAAPTARAPIESVLAAGPLAATCVVQDQPLGMLPAIRCAAPVVAGHAADQVWITWCDQVAISSATVTRLARELDVHEAAALVFPTVRQSPPYIHFARSADGRIVAVRQRREGDPMPDVGESDAGLFALRASVFLDDLATYDAGASASAGTGERNFLPFIPWLARTAQVVTFPLDDPHEAIGINTPADLTRLEVYLRERA